MDITLAPALQTGELPLVMKPRHNDGHGAQQGERRWQPRRALGSAAQGLVQLRKAVGWQSAHAIIWPSAAHC